MAHKDWCGKPCSECESPCALDESIPCSPNCGELNTDGTRNAKACMNADCDAIEWREGECPCCDNDKLTYGPDYLEDSEYVYEWRCKECGASGKALFSLTFVRHDLTKGE